MNFVNKVVIVTGSSSGIGAVTALYFADLSATVVITGRNEKKLAEIAEKCEYSKGIKPLVIKAEMTDDEDVKRIIDETVKAFGRIDILVNNAGTSVKAGIEDGIDPFDRLMATNLRSVYLITSFAVPYLIESKGNIVNVSSISAFKPGTSTPYCVSKAGLEMLTKCLAKDLAPLGVRVNSVNPGVVRTNLQRAVGMNGDEINRYVKEKLKSYPLGKLPNCHDVAEMIIFLASSKASSITGCTHVIDCGTSLM